MDDRDLVKIGNDLNIVNKDDLQSVITQDKLKQFNELNGYDNEELYDDQD